MKVHELEYLKGLVMHERYFQKSCDYLFDLIGKEEDKKHAEYLDYINNKFVFISKPDTHGEKIKDLIIKAIEFVIRRINDEEKGIMAK